jgi:hypothetical protein
VGVLNGAPVGHGAVHGTRGHHRQLAGKINERFQHRFPAAQGGESVGGLFRFADDPLAFPIVTEAGGF